MSRLFGQTRWDDVMSSETFLVTGSMGCIGAWVIRNLARDGVEVIATDITTDPIRPSLVMTPEELGRITFAELDVTDSVAVNDAVGANEVTHIVHLAGLQIPFCQANPTLGSQVNVVGTVNIFEAARAHDETVRGLSYASSLAVLGPANLYPDRPVRDDVRPAPTTLYGAYKQANEATARVFWSDWGVGSVGLRPYVVFGVARDQGMTADLAKAILAAAAGRAFHIRFGADVALQYADDAARIFIESARAEHQGAAVCNLRNDVISVREFVESLSRQVPDHAVTFADGDSLPYPADLDDSGIREILGSVPHTPLDDAIAESLEMYRYLIASNMIDLSQLDT